MAELGEKKVRGDIHKNGWGVGRVGRGAALESHLLGVLPY